MIILDMEQCSEEWYKAKCGVPSASVFDKIITPTGKPSKSAEGLLRKLAFERISGQFEHGYMSADMQEGKDREAYARDIYSAIFAEAEVTQVGFCYKDERRLFGASPDGLVGENGLVQIKNPIGSTMIEYLEEGVFPMEYKPQVQGELLVTDREWSDFFAFHPKLPSLCIRVYRDEAFISLLEAELLKFCDRLDNVVKTIGG